MNNRRRVTLFVTGTDTGVGKTYVACAMMEAAAALGLSTAAVKPVAAGAVETADGLRNDDALALGRAMTLDLDYRQINPFCLREAIAPHIAAAREGRRMGLNALAGYCRGVMMLGADLCLIEGAGGWKVPLNEREFISALAPELGIPVVMVVGMRLGCLNHALLTAQAIRAEGNILAGWIANRPAGDMTCCEENVQTLKAMLGAPLLAQVGHGAGAGDIDMDGILAALEA